LAAAVIRLRHAAPPSRPPPSRDEDLRATDKATTPPGDPRHQPGDAPIANVFLYEAIKEPHMHHPRPHAVVDLPRHGCAPPAAPHRTGRAKPLD
jgi:hypothetical protein